MKDAEKIPNWFLLLSLASSVATLYFMNKYFDLSCATRAMFPYTVEGLKQRGHPIPPLLQAHADVIDEENKACFGNWDDPTLTHWTM